MMSSLPTSSSTNLDMSKNADSNLSFYLNDFEEQQINFICFRLNGNLTYNNIISADFSQSEQQLNDQFDSIFNDLQSNIYFLIRSSNLILSNQNKINLLSNKASETCAEIYKNYFNQPFETKSVRHNLVKHIPVDLVKQVTVEPLDTKYNSPLFTNHKGICRQQVFVIPIDCLVLVDSNTKISKLYELMLDKLNLHMQTIKQCFLAHYQNENYFKPETYHYLIENNSAHLVLTCIYPSNKTDEKLANLRKEIHASLELPTDRPLLRRIDEFKFELPITDDSDKYLVNPHVSAKPSGLQNSKQSLVFGNYYYHHYMQDNFNDSGWGCAYRSFQTIFSWFKLQAYTNKPIPTHREIQQALIDMGDKPKEFLGSSKWIGSLEISYCLSQMLSVDCRIISVSRGSELADKARELQYHFETEGTPVMIGGGVLAHTIIGVDFNELTGDVKYLILDPHYTGSEDIKTITSKGWVAWKDMKFWNENSFYNLCCPIRPKGV